MRRFNPDLLRPVFLFFVPVNILLIHQHFNTPESGGPLRSYYLATALVQKGNKVVVITASPGPNGYSTTLDGMEVVYLPVPYNNRFSFRARAWSFLRFAWLACRTAARFRNFDVCYAMSVPLTVGLCARWIKWRYGMPYWFEVGDLWPDAPIQLGYLNNPFINKLLFAFERSTYRNAKGVVALSVPIRQAILKRAPGCRVELIPNMADCDFYSPEKGRGNQDDFVITYSGALGAANGLHYLLSCAAASLKNELRVKFVISGDGAMLDMLKAQVEKEGLVNVVFSGFLNREGVRDTLRQSDAVFVSYRQEPILQTGCPNKLFDGLAAGKIIIVNFGGWVKEEVEAASCGFFVDPKHPDDFVLKVKEILASPGRQATMGQAARKLAETKYSRRALSESFARLFEA